MKQAPEDPTINLQSIPSAETLSLKGLRIVWLDKQLSIDSEIIASQLTEGEKNYASSMKSQIRRTEFERSRFLLHKVLTVNHTFLPDEMNVPVWPPKVCGSITHKNGHVAVSIHSTAEFHSVGIDCESATKDITHLKQKICTDNDLRFLQRLTEKKSGETLSLSESISLVFSAKEALFKCHHPLGRKMFWFHDAEIADINIHNQWLDIKTLIQTSPMSPAGSLTRIYFEKKVASDQEFWLTGCRISI